MKEGRGAARRRTGRPPDQGFFDAHPPAPLGPLSAALDLPDLTVAFEGMHKEWHAAFLAHFGVHAADRTTTRGGAILAFAASTGGPAHFIEPPEAHVAEINPVFIEIDPDPAHSAHWIVRACTYRVAARFPTAGGSGTMVFASGRFEPRERAVENLLRVAVAWLAVTRGGLLLHAASIVRDGAAWLFFGPSGSGKSTLASRSRRGRVVSDDLTLLLPAPDGTMDCVGSPFRGTYSGGEPVTGRFTVAGTFRILKAAPAQPAALIDLPRVRLMADAVANLPFVVDQLPRRDGLMGDVERALARLRIRALRFRKDDDSHWEAIEAAG